MIGLKIGATVSFLIMLYINYLANALPIGGNTTGDISSKYQTLFTPAGFTFSIWGIIYLLLTIFLLSLFINPNQPIGPNQTLILSLFILVNLLNIAWLFSWHNDFIVLSSVVMLFLLLTLLIILQNITKANLLTYATFSIYTGWISVAFIANIAITITKLDLSIFMNHETTWFYIIIGVSLIIGGYMVLKEHNYYYGGVFLWAYFGIVSKFI
jgi:hypothetical protein